MINLPTRMIRYKGGVTMVSREDNPTYQCTQCYKPWFNDDLNMTLAVMNSICPHCRSDLRKLTAEKPLITD